LSLSSFDDALIGMPGSSDPESRRQVQIFFAIGVPDLNTLSAFPDNWPRAVWVDLRDIGRFEGFKQLDYLAREHGVRM